MGVGHAGVGRAVGRRDLEDRPRGVRDCRKGASRARGRTMRRHMAGLLFTVVAALTPIPMHAQWLDLRVPQRPAVDSAAVAQGREIYQARCASCHGEKGDGQGPVARYLWPRPRDLTAASYLLRTTASGELPTDEDLFRTITLGMSGTAMPAWGDAL